MLRSSLVLTPVALLSFALPQLTHAQEVTYDWSRRNLTGLPVQAGRVQIVRVTNLNPLCYSTSIQARVERAPFDAAAAAKIFQNPSSPSPAPDTGQTPVPTPQSQPSDSASSAARTLLNKNLSTRATLGTKERAEAALLALTPVLQGLELNRKIAHRLTSTLENLDCSKAPNVGPLMAEWRAVGATTLNALSRSEATISEAVQELNAARNGLPVGNQHARLRADLTALINATQQLQRTVPPVARQLAADAPRLDYALDHAEMVHTIDAEHDVRAIRVTLTATPVGGGNSRADTLDIPVRRRIRTVFSTGIAASAANSFQYDRVNRQYFNNGTPTDSVYSTFGRAGGSTEDLLNPALLASVSVLGWDLIGSDFYLTVGTTLRNAGGSGQGLDPLFGVSIGFLDQLLITAGTHYAREEFLLLSGNVDDREVPSTVTRKDAVGTERKWAPFIGFSLRLN